VFFAVLHEPLPGERSLLVWALVLLPYAAIGAVFGQLYLRSQRIGVAILAHALLNAIALVMIVSGAR
jgi:membrane protease YdiL (CAAX protease family)